MEIERRFIIAQLDLPDTGERSSMLRQGYITLDSDAVDLRVRDDNGIATLTMKSRGGLERLETELRIDDADFRSFWPLTEGRRVIKQRHRIELPSGHTAEVDVFEPPLEPLVIAEVEFDTVDEARAFEPPEWFGTEVTEDRRLRNSALAQHGLPEDFEAPSPDTTQRELTR